MKNGGLNAIEIKEHNRALITKLICTNNNTTRNELTYKSNLSSMTVTNITSELIEKNIITESDLPEEDRTIGRSPKILSISNTSPLVAGIWVSKDSLVGTICDLTLQLITAKHVNLDNYEDENSILEKVASLTDYLLNFSNRKILGLGISVIGVVNTTKGSVENVTNFYNIKKLSIKEYLDKKFDIPIFVKNDMQSAALSEMYFGLGKNYNNFIYVGISNGIGSAIISNGQLFNNSTGSCGEFGHMSINFLGEKCDCGSCGCLELYANTPVILNRINQECNCNFNSFEEAVNHCQTSPKAYDILLDVCLHLTYALNNLVNIVDITTIVFGHSGVFIPMEFKTIMADKLNKINVFKNNKKISIHDSKFKENSPLFGSGCIVLDQIFTGKLPI